MTMDEFHNCLWSSFYLREDWNKPIPLTDSSQLAWVCSNAPHVGTNVSTPWFGEHFFHLGVAASVKLVSTRLIFHTCHIVQWYLLDAHRHKQRGPKLQRALIIFKAPLFPAPHMCPVVLLPVTIWKPGRADAQSWPSLSDMGCWRIYFCFAFVPVIIHVLGPGEDM